MDEPLIITKAYDLILYLVPQIAKLPRPQRHTLGERIESMSMDFLSLLIEARYTRDKTAMLREANITLEKMRYSVRLCKDLKIISLHVYEVLSKHIRDIGLQLGGWMKQLHA